MIRHFLTMKDLTKQELTRCIDLAISCKKSKSIGKGALGGKSIALVFQKPSVRTRVSFEVAVQSLGGQALYLAPEDIQLGIREPIKDVARTLSRYVHGIVARTFGHDQVEEFARNSTVPVINGLSELHHPCQAVADLMTIKENFGRLKGRTVAYIGDGNNVLNSLAQGAAMLGMNLCLASPHEYKTDKAIWVEAKRLAKANGARFDWTSDPKEAAKGADVLYTDVWTSMGQEKEKRARKKAFRGFQINKQLLSLASRSCIVMHCLPAHRGEEITEDAMEGKRSVIFDQAENRLHAQKALLIMLFGGNK
jgi:ornithine carbamoyltransferase